MARSGSSPKPAPTSLERPAAPPAARGPTLQSEGEPTTGEAPGDAAEEVRARGTGFAERLSRGPPALQSRLAGTPGPFAGPLVSIGAPPGAG